MTPSNELVQQMMAAAEKALVPTDWRDLLRAAATAFEAANARADAAEAKVARLTEALKDAIDGYEQYAAPYPHANHQDEKDVARLRAALASEASS